MMALRTRFCGQAILLMGLLAMTLPAGRLAAQASAKPSARPSAQGPAHSALPSPSSEEEKLEESREADAIRKSPTISFIARHTGLSRNQAYWLCVGLNFAVIFIAIAVLMRKKLPGYFSNRTSTIQKGIEEARKMSEEARHRLDDVEGRLSRIDADIAAMQREADENANAEERRLLAAGEEERKRIVVSAEQEIDMAANTARRELKSYVAELAIELAEKKIRVTRDADEALVRAFTARMGKDGN